MAVGAVGLGEDDDGVVVNERLGTGLCGGHGGGSWAGEGAEKTFEYGRNGGRLVARTGMRQESLYDGSWGGVRAERVKRGLAGSVKIAGFYPAMMSGDICQLGSSSRSAQGPALGA